MEKKIDLKGKWFVVSKFYDDGHVDAYWLDDDHLLSLCNGRIYDHFCSGLVSTYCDYYLRFDLYVDVFDSREEAVAFANETLNA